MKDLESYEEYRRENIKEFLKLPLVGGFNRETLEKILAKRGKGEKAEDYVKVGDSFIRKEDAWKYLQYKENDEAIWEELKKNKKFMKDAFMTELRENEYFLSHNDWEIMNFLDISYDEFYYNDELRMWYYETVEEYLKEARKEKTNNDIPF